MAANRPEPISRRAFLRRGLFLSAGLAGASLIAACAPASQPAAPTPAPTAAPKAAAPTTAPAAPAAPTAAPKPAAAPTTAPAAPKAAAPQGKLTVATGEDPLTFDTQSHYSISAFWSHRHFYDPLLEKDHDGKFVPMLAESWSNPSPLVWEFKLRPGVKFHDGTPFDAESVKFTLDRVRDPATKSAQAFHWTPVEAVTIKDKQTIQIQSKTPFGAILHNLTLTEMLPPSAKNPDFFQKPVGTGPFKVVSWTKGDRIVGEANAEYWRGAPKIKDLTIRVVTETATKLAALRAGEVDIADRIPPDQIAALNADSNISVMIEPGVETQQTMFNHERSNFKDVRVRRALNLAIDREAIIKELLLGRARVVKGPIPPGVFGYNDQLPAIGYNPAEAKKLLADAGFGGGLELDLGYVLMKGVYSKQLEIAQVIVDQLRDVGVKVKINELEIAAARELRTAGKFDLFFSGWANMTRDGDFALWTNYSTAGAAKLNRYSSKKADELIEKGQTTIDETERAKAYQEAAKVIWDDLPMLYLWWNDNIVGVRKRVQGFRPRPDYFIIVKDASVTG